MLRDEPCLEPAGGGVWIPDAAGSRAGLSSCVAPGGAWQVPARQCAQPGDCTSALHGCVWSLGLLSDVLLQSEGPRGAPGAGGKQLMSAGRVPGTRRTKGLAPCAVQLLLCRLTALGPHPHKPGLAGGRSCHPSVSHSHLRASCTHTASLLPVPVCTTPLPGSPRPRRGDDTGRPASEPQPQPLRARYPCL